MRTGGFSKVRLDRMLGIMAGYIERGEVPGIVTLVSRRDELHVAAMGMKAHSGSDQVRRDTIFLGTLPLMHQPGERWMYNTGSDVLGVLIVRASGLPLEQFLRERIFDPLGMKDTGFSVSEGAMDRLATSYMVNPATGALTIFDEAIGGQWSSPPAFPSGAAGLVSTADDYLAFGRMMLNRGRHGNERILSRPSVELMTTDQLTPEQKARSGLVSGYFDSHGWGF